MSKTLYKAFTLCACLLAIAVWDGAAYSQTPDKYKPQKVARGVDENPLHVSWSSDGMQVAFVKKGLRIYDTKTGKTRKLRIGGLYAVHWQDERSIAVLYERDGSYFLGLVDAWTLELSEHELPMRADMVFWRADGSALVLLQSSTQQFRIGVEAAYVMSVLDRGGIAPREIYRESLIHYGKHNTTHRMSGWVVSSHGPRDTSALLFIYVRPPAALVYLKVLSVDYLSGEAKQLFRPEGFFTSLHGSWSPAGSRLALSDRDAHLRVLDLVTGKVDDPLLSKEAFGSKEGAYPAWNPKSSQLYFGGSLIELDTGQQERIIKSTKNSVGVWSPDGTRLAVVARRTLWLFKDIELRGGVFDRELMEKLRLLEELHRDGLITAQEFAGRRAGLIDAARNKRR